MSIRTRLPVLLATLVVLLSAATAYAVVRTGTDGADTIFGSTGDDRIDGRGSSDIIFGLSGDDRLRGGSGGDNIQADAVCPAGSRDPDACDQTKGTGDDVVDGQGGDDALAGGRGNDEVIGGSGADNIQGGSGRDEISAGSGSDAVYAQAGSDRVDGGTGRDDLFGGTGNDTIRARDGVRDRVDCGAGTDTAVVDRSDTVARNCERVLRR